MFKNLYISDPEFSKHNFSLNGSELRKETDPSWDVEEACRSPHRLYEDLAETLSYTLSSECCAGYLRLNPALPITPRDYYLSKLFQFLYQTLLNESDDRGHWAKARGLLEDALDNAFPEATPPELWNRLADLKWTELFKAYPQRGHEGLIRDMKSRLPKAKALETSPESVNLKQAIQLTGLGERQIRNLATKDAIETVGQGRHKRYVTDSLRQYIGQLPKEKRK